MTFNENKLDLAESDGFKSLLGAAPLDPCYIGTPNVNVIKFKYILK